MTNPSDQITTPQAAVILSSFILGVGIITLPRSATEKLGTPDAWITVIIGGFLSMVVGLLMTKLSQRFPGKTFYQYTQEIVGKGLGWFLSFFLIIYFILLTGFEVRAMAEVIRVFLLVATPVEVTIILLLCVSVYLVMGGVNSIARLYEILLPFTIIFFILVLFLGFKVFELDNLRPVLGDGLVPLIKGMEPSALAYLGFEIMLFLPAFMGQPKKAVKALVIGISIPMILYIFTVILVVGGLSVDDVVTETFPTITLIRSFEVTGILFERFESLLFAVWILQIFTTVALAHYLASLGFAQIFKKSIRPFAFGMLPVFYLIAMSPQNVNEVFTLGDWISYTFVLITIIPVVLYLIAKLRSRVYEAKK